MTQIVHVRDIRAAGGLKKWEAKAARSACPPGRARPPRNGRVYETEAMNATEARYAGYLEELKRTGQVAAWAYEAVKLRLADRTFYTPDFLVVMADGGMELHEVKGHWEDDARVKIKVAARLFPWFCFRAVQWNSKAKKWAFEFFQNRGDEKHE